MTTLRAIAVVLVGLGGVALAVSALPRFRRTTLTRRLTPYLGALASRPSALLVRGSGTPGWTAGLVPLRDVVARRLHRVLGDGPALAERLDASGSELDVSAYRGEQVTWGLVGLVGSTAFALLLLASGRSASPAFVLVFAAVGTTLGVVARERRLSRCVEQRRAAAQLALPTMVDLVCLAVTAGESLRASLGLVADRLDGPLGQELRTALRAARGGTPLVDALASRARVLGLPPFDRFVDAVTAAQERGIPLAESLRALATDVREHERRALIESAGRKQVAMLVPVVTLILPVAIVFAFYPGVVAIRTLAR